MTNNIIIAKPLFSGDKEREIDVRNIDGEVYLFITSKRYIAHGKDIDSAISDANCRTFMTGYRVERYYDRQS